MKTSWFSQNNPVLEHHWRDDSAGILAANLRADGQVIDVLTHPADLRGAGASDKLTVPLDGMPRTRGGRPVAANPEACAGEWTGGFSFAVWDRERQELRA